MDGYVITETAEEAFAAFGKDGVRHVGELDNGLGFVAFEGEIPAQGTVLMNVTESDFWWFKIRRITPEAKIRRFSPGGQTETLALYTAEAFLKLAGTKVVMASPIVGDLILAITRGVCGAPIWSTHEVAYQDIRVQEGALVRG